MIKQAVRNFLLRQFEKRGYSIRFAAGTLDFPALVADLLKKRPEVFFLQVGGFDGISDDPIHNYVRQYHWQGIVVEPQLKYFQKLQKAYDDCANVTLVHSLIGETTGTKAFYTLSDACPPEYHGQASFDKALILKHLAKVADPEQYIIRQELPTLSLAELLTRHKVRRLDLFQVDTEGFDYDILKQLDFAKFRPALIHLEHIHLSPEKLRSALQLLLEKGYKILFDEMDLTAFTAA